MCEVAGLIWINVSRGDARQSIVIGNVTIHPGIPPKEGLNVTAAFISRSSIVAFCLVVGVSVSTSVETVKVMDVASSDGSFIIAQTQGMERRGERRDTRQDCRQEGGLVGKDKRDCKQEGRSN